ncbi:MAG: TolC family protein [Planctomycetaceae bacterium]|nr:TolC family protein [Planctomycetaceae bacterium]
MTRNWTAKMFLVATMALTCGCAGLALEHEARARRDVAAVQGTYRPVSSRPALPKLTPASPLADLIRYAVLNNPSAESAFYQWKAAVEEITLARSLPDPMLNINAEITRSLEGLTPAIMSDPMANWPGPGKLPLRAQQAYHEAQRKRAKFENELLTVTLNVKRSYYQLWVLQEQIRWTSQIAVVATQSEQDALQRLTVGKSLQQDVLRAQMERDRIRNDLANLQDSRDSVLARLRAALGLGPREPLPDFQLRLDPAAADFTEASLLETAMARNPRLKEMRSEVDRAMAMYALAQKTAVPDYSWGVGVNVLQTPLPVMPSFGITLPIWRDKIAAEIAKGQAGVDAARARLSAEELDLAVRFAEAALAWRQADRNVRLYGQQLLPKAKATMESARAGYVAGSSGFLELLEAQRSLLDVNMNHSMAVGQREIAFSELSLVVLGRMPAAAQGLAAPPPVAGRAEVRSSPKK